MTREFCEKRIAGAEKNISKFEKKLARIEECRSRNYGDPNPYYYTEYDYKCCLRDLEEAHQSLENYKAKREVLLEKEASRNVPAITEFLGAWANRVASYYREGLEGLEQLYREYDILGKRMVDMACNLNSSHNDTIALGEQLERAKQAYQEALHGTYEVIESQRGRKCEVKVRDGRFEYVAPYWRPFISIDEMMKDVWKMIERERNRKYDFIIERCHDAVGQITDATGLTVGAKGDLNGLIYGTKGVASVNTFGAGGYNIQCYHFRTTIRKVEGGL